jgi:hypothetical protein
MQIRFISKSAGRFSLSLIFIPASFNPAFAAEAKHRHAKKKPAAIARPPVTTAPVQMPPVEVNPFSEPPVSFTNEWSEFERVMQEKQKKDRIDGLSYVISGSLALVGGLIGQGTSKDPLEKGVYTLFQSIGVASIGYGMYTWKLGDEDRWIYDIVESAPSMSMQDKIAMIRSYKATKIAREKQQRFVRAITHGMIAALNIYGATQQTNDTVKSALYFLGGVNTLAAISFAF